MGEGQGHPQPTEQEEDELLTGGVGTTGESKRKKKKRGDLPGGQCTRVKPEPSEASL